ncbi:IS21 family transposase [Acidithiobacillus sp.]
MPNKRLSMRKITEVLRLHSNGHRSNREIARAVGISRATVSEYLRRAQAAGLGWPLPPEMTERALEALLFPPSPPSRVQRPEPDWSSIHQELGRKGVTLELLWQEYREQHPGGYQYSAFCEHYRAYAKSLPVTLRQRHTPGERLLVDYSGQTVPLIDPVTAEIRPAQIFVAVLGASNYTYVEATWSQGVADWTASHVRCFEFLGGVPELLVPDNLKSGVLRPNFFAPDLQPSYQDLARHYGTAILPARVRKPRDKAKVEAGVLLAQRWILARLRHRDFLSLAELNQAIRPLLVALNAHPFQKLPGSRQSIFTAVEQPALQPLPATRYEFAEWKVVTAGIDYHIEITGHYYSVPYRYARQKLDARYTASTVEIFQKGERIASHPRSFHKGRHSTQETHLAPAHRKVAGWNAQRFQNWAAGIGLHTQAAIDHLLHSRRHPQQAYRAALGVMRLAKTYGPDRLEAACERALRLQVVSWRSLDSILKNGLDRQVRKPVQANLPIDHANVRGSDYYH